MIDDVSDPGSYADKFKDAAFYGQNNFADDLAEFERRAVAAYAWLGEWNRRCDELMGEQSAKSARCYRDRKAHDKLIATTNAIRAKHGMEPLGGGNG